MSGVRVPPPLLPHRLTHVFCRPAEAGKSGRASRVPSIPGIRSGLWVPFHFTEHGRSAIIRHVRDDRIGASLRAVRGGDGEMRKPLTRLTEPMVRENGVLRPATWDEALDRAAGGFRSAAAAGPDAFGMFSCSKATNEMNYLAQKFARDGGGQQQHRQLQPHLTRPQRRRSGDGVRGGRRHQLLPGDGGDRPRSSSGGRTPGDAIRSSSTTCSRRIHNGAKLYVVDPRRTSSAQWADGWLGTRRRHRHRAGQRRWRARSSPPGLAEPRASSSARPAASRSYAASVEPWTLERAERETGVPADADPRAGPSPTPAPTAP